MSRLADIPGVQLVPAAIGITGDHMPEAQRWYEEPSAEQDHSPSSVHAPDCAPVVVPDPLEPDPLEPDAPPLAAGKEALLADVAAAELAAGIGETMAVVVASEAEVPAAPDAKTPAADDDAAAEVTAGADAEFEPFELPVATAAAPVQLAGAVKLVPIEPDCTESPASG